jgi:hypothetical protein
MKQILIVLYILTAVFPVYAGKLESDKAPEDQLSAQVYYDELTQALGIIYEGGLINNIQGLGKRISSSEASLHGSKLIIDIFETEYGETTLIKSLSDTRYGWNSSTITKKLKKYDTKFGINIGTDFTDVEKILGTGYVKGSDGVYYYESDGVWIIVFKTMDGVIYEISLGLITN